VHLIKRCTSIQVLSPGKHRRHGKRIPICMSECGLNVVLR
jgi:hypothetical protein